MSNIYFSSDLHFFHDREFIYKPRGFDSVYDMNDAIIENWNKIVKSEDHIYCLGDMMLNNNELGIKAIKNLKGNIHIVRGNHDTEARVKLYQDCYNVIEVTEGQYFKWNGYNFYLNHYPTFTSNLEKGPNLKQHILNLFGHTHQQTNFYNEIPFMYHVGVDSHNCTPISIEEIISDIKEETKKCIKLL